MKHGELQDINDPEWVQIEIREDGKVVWVHVDGISLFRACRIQNQPEVIDHRKKKKGAPSARKGTPRVDS